MDRYGDAYVEAVRGFCDTIRGQPSPFLASAIDGKVRHLLTISSES